MYDCTCVPMSRATGRDDGHNDSPEADLMASLAKTAQKAKKAVLLPHMGSATIEGRKPIA